MYGVEGAETAEWHRLRFHLGEPLAPQERQQKPPSYEDVKRLISAERLERWKQTLRTLPDSRTSEFKDGTLSQVYHATVNLSEEAEKARSQPDRPEVPPIGPAFERAVLRRVHAWLESAKHSGIRSAWHNVQVATTRDPHLLRAEFDILFVLTNGVLWHLECKSFEAKVKDLDARLFNLQKASSQLAQMALCGPLLTKYADQPWFASQHKLRRLAEGLHHLVYIPFTLPGQPESYEIDEPGTPKQKIDCPTLEKALEKALGGYGALTHQRDENRPLVSVPDGFVRT